MKQQPMNSRIEGLSLKEVIQKLLDSEISAYKIGKEAGVQDSLVKKLRNGDQAIGATKYDNLEKLAEYAIRSGIVNDDADNSIEIENDLPKNVLTFIEDINNSLAYINNANQKAIEKVFVYDEYILDDNGDSIFKTSYIEIDNNIMIPISSKGLARDEWIPYNINIRNKINSASEIKSIKNLRLTFNSKQLIKDLQKEKDNLNNVKMNGSSLWRNNKSRTIVVFDINNNTEIIGYESSYFNIHYTNSDSNEEWGDSDD